MRLYGIPNCDTVKRARAWLDQAGLVYEFVDFKKQPADLPQLKAWAAQLGWERLLNRAGTSWRRLDEPTQALAVDEAGALALMATQPSLIKRPVVDWGDGRLSVGFKPELFQALQEGR